MTDSGDLLSRLEGWYTQQCDGRWEEGEVIKLKTIGNPGWSLQIDLADTRWETAPFAPVVAHRSQHNWIMCEVKDRTFDAVGGPLNLREMITTFLAFVDPTYEPPPPFEC